VKRKTTLSIILENFSVFTFFLIYLFIYFVYDHGKNKQKSGADPGFQVRGGALKKIAPSGGKRENCWGISCEKSRFYAKKIKKRAIKFTNICQPMLKLKTHSGFQLFRF
jgi:hypothetical protein